MMGLTSLTFVIDYNANVVPLERLVGASKRASYSSYSSGSSLPGSQSSQTAEFAGYSVNCFARNEIFHFWVYVVLNLTGATARSEFLSLHRLSPHE